jgi:hypothetical protein
MTLIQWFSGAATDVAIKQLWDAAESKMAQLRVPEHIRDRLFDHVPNRGSGKTYDHFEYQDEMRDAVELWAAHIMQLVTPQGVARLR